MKHRTFYIIRPKAGQPTVYSKERTATENVEYPTLTEANLAICHMIHWRNFEAIPCDGTEAR